MLSLLLIALAQCGPEGPIFSCPERMGEDALFEFAPANGTGMSSPCACVAVTGVKAEALTFTRASSATCLMGGTTTGVANGDMVTCSANQPRVMPGGDGSGGNGLDVWEARTNYALRSQELGNAIWIKNGGTFPVTVTADFGVAPDGTTTADRVQFAATNGAQDSFIYQLNACGPVGLHALSFWVKSVDGGSGVIPLSFNDGANGWIAFPSCSYNGASWSRCMMENVSFDYDTGTIFAMGPVAVEGGQAYAANDVLIWGTQCEAGPNASPTIPTVGAAVERTAETATASYTAAGSTISYAATFAPAGATEDYKPSMALSFSASSQEMLGVVGAKNYCDIGVSGADQVVVAPGQFLTPVPSTSACAYRGATNACSAGYCTSGGDPVTLATGAATLYIGGAFDGGRANGTVKSVCVDPSSTRCAPANASPLGCPAAEPQNIALTGDSIMVGAYAVKVVDVMNGQLCPARGAVSFAVSGASVVDCVEQYHDNIKGHAYGAVATNCGTNNIQSGGDSAAVAFAQLESFYDDVTRDGGFRMVIGNIAPCGGQGGCVPATVSSLNAKIADYCADAGSRVKCIDNYALLGAGSRTVIYTPNRDTHMGNMCLPSSDALHPNNYCTTRLGISYASATVDAGLL